MNGRVNGPSWLDSLSREKEDGSSALDAPDLRGDSASEVSLVRLDNGRSVTAGIPDWRCFDRP